MFYVIQIGDEFFSACYGPSKSDSEVQTASLVIAERFDTASSAEWAAARLRENPEVTAEVRVRECRLVD